MSQGQGGGFLWDNMPWAFSNFDSSYGGTGDEKQLEKKKPLLVTVSSSSPNPTMAIGGRNCKRSSSAGHDQEEDGGKEKDKERGGADEAAKKGGGSTDHEAHIWTERERRKKMRNMFSTLHSLLPHLPPKADKAAIVDEAVNYVKTLQLTLQGLQTKKLERLHGSKATKSSSASTHEPLTVIPVSDQVAASSSRTAPAAASTTNKSSILMENSSTAAAAAGVRTTGTSASTSVAVQLPHHQPLIHPPAPPAPVLLQTWTSPNLVLNIMIGGDDDQEAQFTVCCPKKSGLLTDICFVLDKHKIDVIYLGISSDANRSIYTIRAQANNIGTGAAATQFSDAVVGVEETFKQAAAEMMRFI